MSIGRNGKGFPFGKAALATRTVSEGTGAIGSGLTDMILRS